MFEPRAAQQEVLRYRSGKMGVSAVPGSGKTHTLSYLAAQIIANGALQEDQEVLIVTLVNSAVENFSGRVGTFIQDMGLLPNIGYRVRTLHGLAHGIVRERPALVGLADDFQIIDEREANRILEDVVQSWVGSNPFEYADFLSPELEGDKLDCVRRDKWPTLVKGVASSFVRRAKDLQLTPEEVANDLYQMEEPFALAEMGYAIYRDFQRALAYRGAVDFDDLIRLALQTLKRDADYLARLRSRWPYILEDEAQDSSELQEEILRLLAGPHGNWVRVGDPNQAIYQTFTTANPKYLRDYLAEADVTRVELPNSGRSTQSIINLANRLIEWARSEHPVQEVRDALATPRIEPTPPGDPQPNPPDDPSKINLIARKFTPQEEIQAVVDSLERWLPQNTESTVAVLTPRNAHGYELVSELKKRRIEYIELLQSTSATRLTAGALGNIVSYLADPKSPKKLAMAYRVWRRADREDEIAQAQVERIAGELLKCRHTEAFLWPQGGEDWLDELELAEDEQGAVGQLRVFRELVQRWQGATLLPIDQLLLTLAQDLFFESAELALVHKLAVVLKRASTAHLEWRLPELNDELIVVARNERRLLGFSEDDLSFDPDRHKGKVVIATLHKAKGLEWDRVYLMSVNNFDYPSVQENDKYIGEKWFVRDRMNLEAEALGQLEAILNANPDEWYLEGAPTREARLEYTAERLRLLYVGITRARKELVVTWNTGRQGDQQQAYPFVALQTFWEGQPHASAD